MRVFVALLVMVTAWLLSRGVLPWQGELAWLSQRLWQDVATDHSAVGELLKSAAVIAGGAWALYAFGHARRVKTGELLAQLENGANTKLETLLQLENADTYATVYALPLTKSLVLTDRRLASAHDRCGFEPADDTAIKNLESALRHLHICWHVRGAGSHARSIDDAYSYYVRLVVADARPELRDYVRRFWPNIYQWGKRAEWGGLSATFLAVKYRAKQWAHRLLGAPLPLSPVPYDHAPADFHELARLVQAAYPYGRDYDREVRWISEWGWFWLGLLLVGTVGLVSLARPVQLGVFEFAILVVGIGLLALPRRRQRP